MRPRLFLGILLAVGIAALLAIGLGSQRAASVGRHAPALPREQLAGQHVTARELPAATGGHAALITFWASWCDPCAREARTLERFSQSPSGRGHVIGVDWSDGRSEARSFIRRFAWTFPNLRDADGTVGSDYRLAGLPTTFVLDARGRIRAVLRGPQGEGSLARALASAERG